MSIVPSAEVLRAFGVSATPPRRLSGGQDMTWVADHLVLKPIEESRAADAEAEWTADVLTAIPEAGFRVSRPVRADDGRWVVDHWTASMHIEGEHVLDGRWPEVLRAGERFHEALEAIPRPEFLDQRTNPWSVGDRAAWGDELPVVGDAFHQLIARFWSAHAPVALASQVIHGDLPGNILFAAGLDPAVIDFSPYYRPAGFGLAIVLVDAIVWYNAPVSLAQCIDHLDHYEQLMMRAAIFRLVTADQVAAQRGPTWVAQQIAAHEPIAELLGV